LMSNVDACDLRRCRCVPPAVFVRELAPHEGQRLKRLSKQSKLASTRQRALILRESPRQVLALVGVSPNVEWVSTSTQKRGGREEVGDLRGRTTPRLGRPETKLR
jgi:hypothetical protein